MKTRRRLLLIVCGVVLLTCLLLVSLRRNSENRDSESKVFLESETAETIHQPPNKNSATRETRESDPSRSIPHSVQSGARTDLADRSFDEWRTPINFYGKVVDESNSPVEGASITFGWTDLSDEGYSRTATTSDANGLFSLDGRMGKHLSVGVNKEGYYTSKSNVGSFFYAGENENFIPNPGAPVIFHLRKKGEVKEAAAQLTSVVGIGLHAMRDYPLSPNGEPTELSLRDGRLTRTGQGDLRVELWMGRALDGNPSRSAWKCRVTALGGGLIPTNEEFPFLAPVNGYRASDEWSVGSENWSEKVERQYYVRLSDGDFGRVRIRVIGAATPFFRLESLLNSSGSRNLEPVESKPSRRALPPGGTEVIPDYAK